MTTGFVPISNDWPTLVRTLPEAIGSRAWNYVQGQGQGDLPRGGRGWVMGIRSPQGGAVC